MCHNAHHFKKEAAVSWKLMRVIALAAVAVLAVPAQAQAATTGRQDFHLYVIGPGPVPPGRVIAAGVINSTGTAQQVSIQQNPDGSFAGTNVYTFPVGSIRVNFVGRATSFDFDTSRCVIHFTAAGTFTMGGGTGSFSGASGGGTFSSDGRSILTWTSSGCTPPTYEVTQVTDRGTISLP